MISILTLNLGGSGLEPPASPLSGVCSNQLSYPPYGFSGASVSSQIQFGIKRPSTIISKSHLQAGERPVGATDDRPLLATPKCPKILLRKEVIQPHVPVRLPCYDFTPITNHNLGLAKPGLLLQRTFVV